jgi:hypothetical protein
MTAEPTPRSSYLGPTEMRRLDLACVPIRRAFRATPHLVGSVHTRRDYRDVDVRLILPDDHPVHAQGDIHGLNYALSEYLRLATGLPIDFQIQSQSEANAYPGARNPLGVRWMA